MTGAELIAGAEAAAPRSWHRSPQTRRRLRKRQAAEKRFRAYGLVAILTGVSFVALLSFDIVATGWTAFLQTHIQLEVSYDPEVLGITDSGDAQALGRANYTGVVKAAMLKTFPDVSGRREKRALYGTVSSGAGFVLRACSRIRVSWDRRRSCGCPQTTTSTC